MAVPVQTWGALGTMVAEQHEFGTKTAEYLEANEVHDLFAHLLRQIVINQPENPIKFLQEELRSKPKLCVCIIGPPGIQRSKHCKDIEAEFKIKHIHVGKLLRSSGRKELTAVIDAGGLVDDNIVIELVKGEIAKLKGQGWVLDGFPRTKVQAQALTMKSMGFCLDRVLLLHTSEKAIRQRYEKKVTATGYTAAAREEIINTRLQQYQRHVISIAELFKNMIRRIEVSAAEEDQQATYNLIKANLHVRPYSNAPLRCPRICIVGPCGSGRTTQCRAIAKQYGVVHVDLSVLLRKHQEDTGRQVEEIPPEYVSDEELCAVVGKRLNETDCMRKGWVLDGFPKTQAQAEFLRQAHLWPTRLVVLKVDEADCVNRISTRRLDPVTCTAYYKSPNSVVVRQRLVQAPYDQPDAVRERFRTHDQNVDRVCQIFPIVSLTVRAGGEQDYNTVTQQLFSKLDQPVASELTQDTTADQDTAS